MNFFQEFLYNWPHDWDQQTHIHSDIPRVSQRHPQIPTYSQIHSYTPRDIHRHPHTATDTHRYIQTLTDTNSRTQALIVAHKLQQIATDSDRSSATVRRGEIRKLLVFVDRSTPPVHESSPSPVMCCATAF